MHAVAYTSPSPSDDYISRVVDRVDWASAPAKRVAQAGAIAKSGEDHFARLSYALKRYTRAKSSKDDVAMRYERDIVRALMYEILDTFYLVIAVLDLDRLELQSSGDGFGFVGEQAADVVRILGMLDAQAKRLIEAEAQYDLRADFVVPVDEKQGVTFIRKRHWQDFVPGSTKESFYGYFQQAQVVVKRRLEQRPSFWARQTFRDYLSTKGYKALLAVLLRLDEALLSKSY